MNMKRIIILLLVILAELVYTTYTNYQTNQKIAYIEEMYQEIIADELLRIIENNLSNQEMPCIHNN